MLEKNQEKFKSYAKNLKIWAIYLTILVIIGGAVLAGIILDKVLKGTPGGGIEVSPKKVEAIKSFLGTELLELTEVIKKQLDISTNQGVLVNSVIDGSPADEAGMQRGDVIMRFDRQRIRDVSHMQEIIAETSPDNRVKIVVERDKKTKVFYVKLGEIPAAVTPVALTQVQPQGQTPPQLGWGMSVAPIDPEMGQKYGLAQSQKGILVTGIIPGGSASAAGIQVGDIILVANNQPTEELSQFYTAIAGSQSVVLDILRNDKTSYVTVQTDPSKPPVASLGMTTMLTGENPNESDDEGYKGMPPVIPPKGEYDPETMGPRTTAGTQNRVEMCICPLCGTTVTHQPGIPCYEMECPVCGSRLINASPGVITSYDDSRTPIQGDPQRPSYAGAAKGQRDLNPTSLSGGVQTGGGSSDEEEDKGNKPSSIPPMGNPSEAANVINIYQVGGQPTSNQPSDIPSMGKPTSGGQTVSAQTTAGGVNRVQACVCPVCGTTVGHPAGISCAELTCPECGSRLIPVSPGANFSTSQQGNMPASTGQSMAQGGGQTGANSSTSQQGNRPPSTGQGMAQGGSAGSSRYGSSGSGGPGGECVCPNCGTIVQHTASVPCYEMSCPRCGTPMVRAIPGVTINAQKTDFLLIAEKWEIITPIELKAKIDSGGPFILLDVRSESMYNAGHISGAISMSIDEIPDRYVELSPNQEIIVYCQIGKTCQDAADMLVKLGFTNVKVLVGGISAWEYGVVTAMGYTTSDKPETIPPTDKGQQIITIAGCISQKVALSSEGKNLSSKIAPLFDRSPYFIIVGLGSFQVFKNPNVNDSKDVGIQSAQFVVDKGAGSVITNNISLEAMKELCKLNVKVYSGVSGTVSQALEWYMDERLTETTLGTDKSVSGSHDEGEGKSKEKKGRDAERTNVVL